MVDWVQKLILGSVGRSVIRKLMTLIAGVLVGVGINPELVNPWVGTTTEILIAVLLYLVAQTWSIVEKKALKKGP